MQEAASLLHVLLQELELPAFLKTSGGKGLHVVVPIKRLLDWDTVKAFSQAVVQHLAHAVPQRFVAKSGPRNRVGKIFVDYLRNGFGATTACAWTARARPGMGISVPVAWNELDRLDPAVKGMEWRVVFARREGEGGCVHRWLAICVRVAGARCAAPHPWHRPAAPVRARAARRWRLPGRGPAGSG